MMNNIIYVVNLNLKSKFNHSKAPVNTLSGQFDGSTENQTQHLNDTNFDSWLRHITAGEGRPSLEHTVLLVRGQARTFATVFAIW